MRDWKQDMRDLGMRQADLARALGVTPDTVSRWGDDCPSYVWAYLGARLETEVLRREVRAFAASL